jgi:hypothetical protein
MRLLYLILYSFLLINLSACKCARKTSEGNVQTKTEEKILLKVDSLKNTSRKIYLHKNKKLDISELNGSLIYKIEYSEKTSVIQFVYERDMDKVAYDGGYREEVVFEVPNDVPIQDYKDAGLQETKMLFGRYCFCRGKTGLYKVRQGKLHVVSSKKEIHFELEFKIIEVPQETEKIAY